MRGRWGKITKIRWEHLFFNGKWVVLSPEKHAWIPPLTREFAEENIGADALQTLVSRQMTVLLQM
jgi:hypothetical protein